MTRMEVIATLAELRCNARPEKNDILIVDTGFFFFDGEGIVVVLREGADGGWTVADCAETFIEASNLGVDLDEEEWDHLNGVYRLAETGCGLGLNVTTKAELIDALRRVIAFQLTVAGFASGLKSAGVTP